MQQIERYGVIALVFLLVTIVAVSFWGDSKSPGFWSRLTGKGKKEEVAKVDPPAVTSEQAIAGGAPLNPTPAPENALVSGTPTTPETQPVGGASTLPGTQVPAPIAQDPAVVGTQPLGSTQPLAQGQPPFPVTPPAPVEPAPAVNEYTVQKGDSLALIARRTLGSEQRWTELQTLNPGVTPKSLKIGMKLKLPEGATAAAQPKTTSEAPAKTAAKSAPKSSPKVAAQVSTKETSTKSSAPKGGARYTIQRGDTLNAIAEKKLGSKTRVKDILALNPGLDPKKLVVGKSITLPSGGGEKAPLVAAATTSTRSGGPRVR